MRHRIIGVCPEARGAVLAETFRRQPSPVWLVVDEDLKAAEQLAEDAGLFQRALGGPVAAETLVFPESVPDSRDMREAFAASSDRLTVLSRLRAARSPGSTGSTEIPLIVFTTPAALLQPVPAIEQFATREITIERGAHQPFQQLLERLRELDYDSEAVCEAPGHYAVRGGIIDVYRRRKPIPHGAYELMHFHIILASVAGSSCSLPQ